MTRDEYVEDIKLDLGAPIVEVEIEELLGKQVDRAFRFVKRYITETRFQTIPYSTTGMNVRQYDIDSIQFVLRTHNPARTADFTDIYTLSTLNTGNSSPVNLLLSDYLYRTQMTQIKNTISTDLDWTFDAERQILYVNAFYPIPESVTLVYIPNFKDVSDVHERYWMNYIGRLALAYSKIALGHVRGKYDLSSSLYKLDGERMLSEGIAERDSVIQELDENSDLVFPID